MLSVGLRTVSVMAFGQAAGPPANARRVAELADLLDARGFTSFREARHPFGLTQRQAGGKFTTDEVDDLIARLEAEAEAGTEGPDGAPAVATEAAAPANRLKSPAPRVTAPAADRHARRRSRQEEQVTGMDADVLATELVNRGWCCIPPD